MKDYVTRDFLRAELSKVRAEMSQHSENQANRLNGMMLKIILGILIPILTLMLGLYFKI